eukprot:7339935-Pyramimonas_sp.AAC.1
MRARGWLVHLFGRANASMPARATASWLGPTDAAAVALAAGHFPTRAWQCESASRAGAVPWERTRCMPRGMCPLGRG